MRPLEDIEFSVYSQNGEDGIIDYLRAQLKEENLFFAEIGCGSGKENNTSYLASQGLKGVVVDGKKARVDAYIEKVKENGWNTEIFCHMVDRDSVKPLYAYYPIKNPDVFSLDIDSVDYWVMKEFLELGFRPKIAVVEYNAGFIEMPITVPYRKNYRYKLNKHLDFGAGVSAWRYLFSLFDYEFFTVDSAGVNAFFISKDEVKELSFIDTINRKFWVDCRVFAESIGPAKERLGKLLQKNLGLTYVGD